jgi:demethylmenaquinone methyltransferase/2-methoxy-6-polyprenyl-1,4-benzoquinol methylase
MYTRLMTKHPKGNIPKPSQDSRRIREMFAQIAPRYDLLNRILSAGTDVAWRRLAVAESVWPGQARILDLACGTGDLALEIRRAADDAALIVGADFAGPMLRLADRKSRRVSWVEADGLNLPFRDQSFDLVTIAFGLRNMESLDGALREIRRILVPGGRLAVLEFSQPENAAVKALYMPYFLKVLPRIGAILSQESAYLYLPHSVMHFPGRRELARRMKQNGFSSVRHCALSFGIAALHIAEN